MRTVHAFPWPLTNEFDRIEDNDDAQTHPVARLADNRGADTHCCPYTWPRTSRWRGIRRRQP